MKYLQYFSFLNKSVKIVVVICIIATFLMGYMFGYYRGKQVVIQKYVDNFNELTRVIDDQNSIIDGYRIQLRSLGIGVTP